MASKLSSMKSVRSRYRNSLDKEMTNAVAIVNCDIEKIDKEMCRKSADKCVKLIQKQIEKLESHIDKLGGEISEMEQEWFERIAEEDNDLIERAESIKIDLEQFIGMLDKRVIDEKEKLKEIEEESKFEMLKMQKLVCEQMEKQIKFFEKYETKENKNPVSVKLPKLEINVFNGNKLEWIAFWDAFECTVHNNSNLSNIEKLTYLKSKLKGEALKSLDGISLSNDNYVVAVDLLKKRFGNPQEVISLHYKEIMNLQAPTHKFESLRMFMDQIEKHFRSLEVLGENVNQNIFVPMVTSKLPLRIIRQLELRKGTDTEWTIERLRNDLREFIVASERSFKASQANREEHRHKGNNGRHSNNYTLSSKSVSSGEVLMISENRKPQVRKSRCVFCKEQHWSDECKTYSTIGERRKALKGSCFKCLKEGHMSNECRSKKSCVHCGEFDKHHRSLCPKKFGTKNTDNKKVYECTNMSKECVIQPIEDSESPALVSSNEMVLMQTAKVEVSAKDEKVTENVRLLMDSGSQRSYITESLAKKLNLKLEREQEIALVTFGSDKPKILKTKSTTLSIKLVNGGKMTITANVVPTISGNIQRQPLSRLVKGQVEHLVNSVTLADSIPTEKEVSAIQLLIGNDYYLDIAMPQRIEIKPGLYLLSSKLGWILTGRTSEVNIDENNEPKLGMLLISHKEDHMLESSLVTQLDSCIQRKPDLTDFWNVETIGIKDTLGEQQEDKQVIEHFKDTVKFVDGRYEVRWPWKDENPELPVNKELAYGRLKSCVRKLKGHDELMEKYNSVIKDQLEKGIIEKVDNTMTEGRVHYIPHHAVLTPHKNTTKLRVVYDASAKPREHYKSLNECLFRGPVMLQNLVGLLLRFRMHRVAITADIEKAFLQVGLQPDERNVTRFLWLKSDQHSEKERNNIQEYRFCRIPFGVISSPFLLGAVIETHLDSYDTAISNQLKSDIYVDNLVTGTVSTSDALSVYNESKQMFEGASMNLREWVSNSEEFKQSIPEKDRGNSGDTTVLGHGWNSMKDVIYIQSPKTKANPKDLTKRSILEVIASVFDPQGLFSVILIRGKILLQEIWKRKYGWDDVIDDKDICEKWFVIENDFKQLSSSCIDRCIAIDEDAESVNYNLLCFCDASKSAYAAAVYLHQYSKRKSRSDLVFSKTRLAPIKNMSVPRLELMAVVIGVECLKFVERQCGKSIENLYLWTDSSCVIGWLKSKKQLPVFVKNRVSQINKHDEIIVGHVASKQNPADLATRGLSTKDLVQIELWWKGPRWVMDPIESWPSRIQCEETERHKMYTESESCVKVVETSEVTEPPCTIQYERFSSAMKLFRVTAYVLRFIAKLKKQPVEKSSVTVKEIQKAEKMWISYVQHKHYSTLFDQSGDKRTKNLQRQLGLYVDEYGIVRCRGRFENLQFSEGAKCPMLLPKSDYLTSLIIEKAHINNLHSGVSQTLADIRHRFWLPHGRSVVKSVIRNCNTCRRFEGGPYRTPPFAPFPESRVIESVPFKSIGIDYFGPLYIKTNDGRQKVWVCLFTCLVTRAIHLEIIMDMSADQFLLCLRRFIANRGTPEEIISDNASQFKAASEMIKHTWQDTTQREDILSYVSNKSIKWTFITEMAPWMGGFYERLIGIVKRSMRKSIGRRLLGLVQLQTLMKEVESVVNSRPLVYVDDDINSSMAITPSHFLSIHKTTGIPESETDMDETFKPKKDTSDKLLATWKKGQIILNEFWKIWRGEYLLSLRERQQKKGKHVQSPFSIRVGDVVLIKDNMSRGSWKMGKVQTITKSKDGYVRSARVQLHSKKILTRPVGLLYPLECSKVDSEKSNVDSEIP